MMTASELFSETEKEQLVDAITRAELHTSGEIRVHVENWCWFGPQWRAKRVFRKLAMHETRERTGVLIYVAVRSHKIAVIGDKAINAAVPLDFWNQAVRQLTTAFREKRYAQGLTDAVDYCGKQLAEHFPGSHDNPDELTNEISFG
ncbi:MAG: TPM domain-containing protein [Bacteroidia bacterium]